MIIQLSYRQLHYGWKLEVTRFTGSLFAIPFISPYSKASKLVTDLNPPSAILRVERGVLLGDGRGIHL